MAKSRQYDGDGIRVGYDARRCIHAAECVRGLPEVFDPERRPWIQPRGAAADRLAEVVMRCPSGALTFERLDGGAAEEAAPENVLRVTPAGPIYASGRLVLLDAEHRELGPETRAAFCRCGASRNKPYCDGRHTEIGFTDPGRLGRATVRPPEEEGSPDLRVRLRSDGPLVLEGAFTVLAADGQTAAASGGAMCRCGASKNKPFCDGSHREIGFEADDPAAE